MRACAEKHRQRHLKRRLREHAGGRGDLGLETGQLLFQLVDRVLLVLEDLILDAYRVLEPVCVSRPSAPRRPAS